MHNFELEKENRLMKQLYFSLLILLTTGIAWSQPLNDNPCGATALTLNSSCVNVAATNVNATNTAGVPDPGCANYNGQDVWFRATVPANGCVIVTLGAGTMTDSGMAFYTAVNCNAPLTLIDCDDDSGSGAMSKIIATALTPLSTLYIRVWDFGGGTGTFNICAQSSVSPCGGAVKNDYCPYPATLTQGPGNFSATTDGTFSPDKPGNLEGVFCGTIENNSWYQFVANATSHSFPIVSVTGCSTNKGIQAQVYSIGKNLSGCCQTFTSMSNCYNPGSTALGTVTATGLTIGQTYYLMIDGWSGDGCEFTISGWSAIGILPVELSEFSGRTTDYGNILNWTTESEFHNDHFEIEYSRDAYSFEVIGKVQGSGTSQQQQKYSFLHQGVVEGTNYYQLVQVDSDGQRTVSKMLSIKNEEIDGLFKVFPNPANSELTLTFQSNRNNTYQIQIIDEQGVVVEQDSIDVTEGISNHTKNIANLRAGVYTLVINTNDFSQRERIIIVH